MDESSPGVGWTCGSVVPLSEWCHIPQVPEEECGARDEGKDLDVGAADAWQCWQPPFLTGCIYPNGELLPLWMGPVCPGLHSPGFPCFLVTMGPVGIRFCDVLDLPVGTLELGQR